MDNANQGAGGVSIGVNCGVHYQGSNAIAIRGSARRTTQQTQALTRYILLQIVTV